MKLQHKSLPVATFKVVDSAEGVAEMIVSVFNNVDGANERILPGFFTDSLKTKFPKGVWAHDWTIPVAKTLEACELLPGDPRLPPEILELGGLYIKGQFNLGTQRGREAFSDLDFGTIDEFSIGYLVEKANFSRDGVRDLTKGRLFEWSPVLVGCNDQTALIGTKDMKHFKSQYMPNVEQSMTRTALSTLVDSLFYDVFYDAIYGSWVYDDELDDWVKCEGGSVQHRAILAGALAEFSVLVLQVFDGLMSLDGTKSIDAAKSMRTEFLNPELTASRAEVKLVQHSALVLAAVKELSERTAALKALRVSDGRDISDANAQTLKGLSSELQTVITALGDIAHKRLDTISALRLKSLENQSQINALSLGEHLG